MKKYEKPCNKDVGNGIETKTKSCSNVMVICCLHCDNVKKCFPRWKIYKKNRHDQLIHCIKANNPRYCSSVLKYLEAREFKPEKVDFT